MHLLRKRELDLATDYAVLEQEIADYQGKFLEVYGNFNLSSIIPVVKVLHQTMMSEDKTVFVCGNGGSASLSQHFSIDLGLGTKRFLGTKGCRVIDLTSNAAIVTATANDVGYEYVFSDQVNLLANANDLLVTISSSGNSRNILNALEKAKELGVSTIGLTGFDGGKMRSLVDYSIHVDTNPGDYGMVEDVHSFILHCLTHLVRFVERRAQ